VGRITPYKRLECLLEAWKMVEREHDGARLVVAGRAQPRYLKRLLDLSGRLGLGRVEFRTGVSRREKKTLLGRAKVLVYTSVREGWGLTVVEANACGTPAVGYDVPGLRDSIRHGETGVLVPPGDVEALAEAVTTLLVDDGFREKLSRNALEWSRRFSWDRTAETFLNVVESTLYG